MRQNFDNNHGMLARGTPAPPFELPDQHGRLVRLSDFAGRWVLLWWYPMAETPGCTVESQGLRDEAERFIELDTVVLGASFDPPEANLAFAEAQDLPFQMLSDVDRTVGTAYEVARDAHDKYARFARRYSYLISPEGLIHRAYDVTDVANHAIQVIADLERAQ